MPFGLQGTLQCRPAKRDVASEEAGTMVNTAEQGVDVALVLAADCSGSIGNEELALQFRGYARAITNEAFIKAVRSGPHRCIVLTFAGWSSADRQEQIVPWMVIDGMPAARRFASALLDARPLGPGYTSISGAIDFAGQLLSASGHQPDRQVIDVSGDGINNDGRPVADARDAAIAAGITINGLPIIGSQPDIVAYYIKNVIGGPGSFVAPVTDAASFHASVLKKFLAEIALAPGRVHRA